MVSQYSYLNQDYLSNEVLLKLIKSARTFILITLKEFKQRIPFESQVFEDIKILSIKNFTTTRWLDVCKRHPNVIFERENELIINELNSFEFRFEQGEFNNLPNKNDSSYIIKLWLEFKEDYPLMFELASALLVLPYSSVNVERLFSNVKVFKTSKRNRLNIVSLESSLLTVKRAV